MLQENAWVPSARADVSTRILSHLDPDKRATRRILDSFIDSSSAKLFCAGDFKLPGNMDMTLLALAVLVHSHDAALLSGTVHGLLIAI